MKLICPHCGLKGIADDSVLDRKLRCPQCQKMFRLQKADGMTVMPVVEGVAQKVDVLPKTGPEQLKTAGVGTCSGCGFSLSAAFLEERNGKTFCRICLPN